MQPYVNVQYAIHIGMEHKCSIPARCEQGTLSPADLTKTITGCGDLDSLDQVIMVHGKRFKHMHVNAAMNKVVNKLKR